MSSSRALKWFVAVLLPLTLGLKFALHSQDESEPVGKSEDKVAEFLVRERFTLIRSEQMAGEMAMIRVASGACHMLVAVVSPRGWHRDMVQKLTPPTDRAFVVFRGQVYAEQPMLLTILDFLWAKFLSQLGWKAYTTPVYAVIATPNCNAEKLPWAQLR